MPRHTKAIRINTEEKRNMKKINLYNEEEVNIQTLEDVFEQNYPPEFDGRRWLIRRGSMKVHVYINEENVHIVGKIYQGLFSKFFVLYNGIY